MNRSRLTLTTICVVMALLIIAGVFTHFTRENAPDIVPSQQVYPIDAAEESPAKPLQGPGEEKALDTWGEEIVDSIVEDSKWKLIPASVSMRKRLAQQVDMLTKESLQESLSMLSEIEMFYWPGEVEGPGELSFPLMKEDGQCEAGRCLSNRRFLKLLRELRSMPTSEAARMINAEIAETLPVYQRMFEDTWRHVLTQRAKHPVEGLPDYGAGPSLQISNNPDHSPTLSGARHKILSLLILAGNLNLSGTESEVRDVIAEAIKQRDRFYNMPEALLADRHSMLGTAGLYVRQVLATGLLGVQNSKGWRNKDRWTTHELTAYDAEFTPYDMMTRFSGPLPADYSKGRQLVKVHLPLDDSEFDSLLQISVNAD